MNDMFENLKEIKNKLKTEENKNATTAPKSQQMRQKQTDNSENFQQKEQRLIREFNDFLENIAKD